LIDLLENKYKFKRDHAEKSILNNKHNHVTTTYYLLQQKFEKLNGDAAVTNHEQTVSDILKPVVEQIDKP
jgi:predicted nuclease with TOPRIM domain